MAFINQSDGARKMSSLVDSLTAVDRRRPYRLSVATCYCNTQALRTFIDAIACRIRISGISLYLDRKDAIKIGYDELHLLREDYGAILSIFAVRSGRLFHTKGYCLAAYKDEQLVEARLAIGSSNLTNSGLIDPNGNIESIVIRPELPLISQFLDFFKDESLLIPLDELTVFSSDDSANDLADFQYALLTLGNFSHKWSVSLTKYLSVQYHLNDKGRRDTRTPTDLRGFGVEAATIAKSYFEFDVRRWRPVDDGLTTGYGIECFLGRWVPKTVLRGNEKTKKQIKKFKRTLFGKLDKEMSAIQKTISQDYKAFIQDGIIDELDTKPTTRFRGRVEALRTDDDLLDRIWSGRYFFELPYDIGDTQEIAETYEDILLTSNLSKRKNKTMKAIIEADEARDLAPLEALSDADG